MIDARNITLDLGGRRVLDGLSFSVEPGESVALVGPNGSGKTSVLRCLLGLVPYRGEARIDGHDCARGPSPPARASATCHSAPASETRRPRRLCASSPTFGALSLDAWRRPCERWVWKATRAIALARSPAGCSSASRWPQLCSPIRRCCCSTSPPPAWTAMGRRTFCASLPSCAGAGVPFCCRHTALKRSRSSPTACLSWMAGG